MKIAIGEFDKAANNVEKSRTSKTKVIRTYQGAKLKTFKISDNLSQIAEMKKH